MILDRSEKFFAGLDGQFTIVEYSNPSVAISYDNICDGMQLQIKWKNIRLQRGESNAGIELINFMNSGTLASELHSLGKQC